MTVADPGPTIHVGDTADSQYDIPVEQVLTGRGFVTGKSGSGKSNTASVVVENLLDEGFPVLIVDSDGEYYGLKEAYEVLHAGADEECDIQVSEEHAEKLSELALDQNVPVILDVSGFLDEDAANALVRETARQLFAKEKKLKQPFLLLVEECHEYIPEGAGLDDTGRTLIKIAKRGRKHGLGIVGISQRPADVKKDFITQCDWLCWHRLTWDNDTSVVRRVVDSETADSVEDLADGEAFAQADWADSDLERVQFHRKRTFDAGATPGLDDVDRPDLQDVSGDLVDELQEISDEQQRREDEIERLRSQLDEKDERIEELERKAEKQEEIAEAAQQLSSSLQSAVSGGEDVDIPDDWEKRLEQKNDQIHDLEYELEDVRAERDQLSARVDDLQDEVARLEALQERVTRAEEVERQIETIREWAAAAPDGLFDVDVEDRDTAVDSERVAELEAERDHLAERVDELEAERDRLVEQVPDSDQLQELEEYDEFLDRPEVTDAIEDAKEKGSASPRYVKGVVAAIVAENGWVAYDTVAERLDVSTTSDVSKAASALERRGVVKKEKREGKMHVDLNLDGIKEIVAAAAERERTEELMDRL